jgi:ribosome maturation factor RimP
MKQKKRNKQVISATELSKYESLVRPVTEKIVSNLGFHLVEVSFIKENQENYLRITVMHEDRPVSTFDCETISRSVGKELDSSDPIPFAYMLEVQSRGTVAVPLKNPEHEFILEKTGLTVRS